jgi:DNA-binding NtrC family response regulator
MDAARPWILVVDDDADTCQNLADILTDLGYRVDTAPDGPAALELVRRRAYDVALLDYKMPGMDGLTLYREIKRLRADTVAIVVTAYASGTGAEEALAAGAWQVLPKPVDFGRLLGLVEEAVGQPLVLVVDDDRDLCATLWDVLRERRYRVGLAHDVAEAEVQARDRAFQAVLLDLRLPAAAGPTCSGGCGRPTPRPARSSSPVTGPSSTGRCSSCSTRGPTPSATSRSTCRKR